MKFKLVVEENVRTLILVAETKSDKDILRSIGECKVKMHPDVTWKNEHGSDREVTEISLIMMPPACVR